MSRLVATRRLSMVAAVLVLVAALVVSNALASTSHAKSMQGPRAPALVLPSANQCVSHRALTIQVPEVSGVTVLGVTVEVDGKLFKKFKRSQVTQFL